jgi:hypothetical protein
MSMMRRGKGGIQPPEDNSFKLLRLKIDKNKGGREARQADL